MIFFMMILYSRVFHKFPLILPFLLFFKAQSGCRFTGASKYQPLNLLIHIYAFKIVYFCII